jgi:peptidoglycan-associated lipoprotein
LAISLGCGNQTVPPSDASAVASTSEPASDSQGPKASAGEARNDSETTVHISDEIMSECRMQADPSEVPRFDLDQSTLRPRGRNILDDVATCMKNGPLENRTITLIGRTDARGTSKHNQVLAGSRADAARNYLLQKGVTEKKMLVIARGEQSATGNDEATWALDRRVDLELGDHTERTNISQNPPANAKKPAPKAGAAYSNQAEGGTVTGSSGPGTASGK